MKLQVVDNFFDNFQNIEQEIKKISLYPRDEFNKKFGDAQKWPGFRSEAIHKSSPLLFNLFLKEFKQKFLCQQEFNIDFYLHLRLGEDQEKDWIHKDPSHMGLIIYLKDHKESGTDFYYEDSDDIHMSIRSVKNRCILFDAATRHKSILNYGKNLEEGRLTLNGFIYFKNNG